MPQLIPQTTAEVIQQASTQTKHVQPVLATSVGIGAQPSNSPAIASSPSMPSEIPGQEQPKPSISQAQRQDQERFQALARREQALRQQARAFQKSQEEFKQAQAQLKAEQDSIAQAKTWKERITSPDRVMDVLTEAGYTTDQITGMLANQPGPQEQYIKQMQDKIAKLEEAQQASLKKYEDDQAANYQSAVKQLQANVNSVVEKNPEFETVKAYGAQKNVTKYIEEVYKEEGVLLDVEEAAKDVEELLLEQAIGVAKLKKVQSKLNPPKPQAPSQSATQAAPPKAPTPTLTNKISASGKPMSAKERAIAAFKGELK